MKRPRSAPLGANSRSCGRPVVKPLETTRLSSIGSSTAPSNVNHSTVPAHGIDFSTTVPHVSGVGIIGGLKYRPTPYVPVPVSVFERTRTT